MSLDTFADRPLTALVRHNIALVLRDSAPLLGYVIMPLLLMTVLRPLLVQALGSRGIDQLAAGQAVMFSLFALGVAASHIFTERERRTLDRMRVTPVGGGTILVGKLAPLYVVLVVQQVLLLTYAVVLLGLDLGPAPLLVLAVTAVWSVVLLAGAAAVGLTMATNGQLNVVKDLGAMSLSLLGGALVPHALLPGFLQPVAAASPAYWAVSAYRAALDGDAAAVVGWLGVLALCAVVVGVFASWRVARGALRPIR